MHIDSNNEDNNQYLVLDVETNGFRTKLDDLLSVSIFDPSIGYMYNRNLHLELEPVVFTTFVNGITTKSRKKFTQLDVCACKNTNLKGQNKKDGV